MTPAISRNLRVRARVFISGFVQGVFFRYETRKMARRYAVTGWVRNLYDGRVEAVFEGERKDVDAMIAFCKKGPPSATVTRVEVFWEEPTGESKGFQVRY
ncbi:MAG: acylphosphatase [Candidatus Bathyarchaeota archaeon]|nr:acylphosphatase [Candidatus Bathyarchaeota archaeon]